MAETYSIGLALYDFIPVIFFLVAGIHLVKITLITLQKYLIWIFVTGVSLIFFGGAIQATWKLLYAANVADVWWMSKLQFILMSIGYIGMLIPLLVLARSEKQRKTHLVYSIAFWKLPFLIVMTLACLGTYATLAVISYRRDLKTIAAGFIISFIGVILMGFLASRPQMISLQWIEQSLNSIINISFALSSFFLYRNYRKNRVDEMATALETR